MTRAKQYHLNFVIRNVEGVRKHPAIVSDLNADGTIKADGGFLDFIDGNKEQTLRTISEIEEHDWQNNTYPYEAYIRVEGPREEYAVLVSPPPRLRFPVEYDVPVPHVLEILNEWLDFLNSTPYEYL